MGQIAAVISRRNADVSDVVRRMLENASPYPGDAHGLASEMGARISAKTPEIPGSPSMLGHKHAKVKSEDPALPLSQHAYTAAYEGRIWHSSNPSDANAIMGTLSPEPRRGAEALLGENCSLALAVLDQGRLLCARDTMGLVPLYIGEDEGLIAVASNRKMLWTAGLDARAVQPGHVTEINLGSIKSEPVRTLSQPPTISTSMEDAVKTLDGLLTRAVEAKCRGAFKVAIGFSGGIDSSLLAHYADKAGARVDLICVGMEGTKGFEAAETAADALDLPLRLETFTADDVEEDLDAVLWSVEEPDPMKIGVGIPTYWAARSAAETGHRIFISGNCADEVFGGYQKYAREYASNGDSVRETMYRDVASSHEANFERDYKICSDLGLELRLPFADIDVVRYGLSLPTGLKLSEDPASPRKLILRALAREKGFPEELADRPKKAVQYSTGVNRALQRLAKAEGKRLRVFLAEKFALVKEEMLGEMSIR
jgi:asparagine synthetase B (glutamine-hydrolysing)